MTDSTATTSSATTPEPVLDASVPTDLPALLSLVAELQERIRKLEGASAGKRDRGPTGEREMTEEDAFRIRFGDLKDLKHKAAAEALGLSYGQVYSARGGYTFKQVTAQWTKKS